MFLCHDGFKTNCNCELSQLRPAPRPVERCSRYTKKAPTKHTVFSPQAQHLRCEPESIIENTGTQVIFFWRKSLFVRIPDFSHQSVGSGPVLESHPHPQNQNQHSNSLSTVAEHQAQHDDVLVCNDYI
jgi:hypothetical protein